LSHRTLKLKNANLHVQIVILLSLSTFCKKINNDPIYFHVVS